jgi:hypothetical protein
MEGKSDIFIKKKKKKKKKKRESEKFLKYQNLEFMQILYITSEQLGYIHP